MQSPSGDRSMLPLSTVVVLTAVVGGALWYSPPLRSFRPSVGDGVPEERVALEDVDARLWQDPFEAVARHRKLREVDERGAESVRESLARRCCGAVHTGDRRCVAVVPVLVPGGSWAESVETRLRTRYAVVSALSVRGYHPEDREHIGFLTVPRADGGDPAADEGRARPQTVPFEWFVPNTLGRTGSASGTRAVLALWLDEAALGIRPLGALRRIVGEIATDPGEDPPADRTAHVALNVLGPGSSNTLIQMMKEVRDEGGESGGRTRLASARPDQADDRPLTLYNFRATAPENLLIDSCWREADGEAPASVRDWFAAGGIAYRRTICPDDELALALVHELRLRGVDLTDPTTDIALIGELDTFYGRALPETLEQVTRFVAGRTEAGAPGAPDALDRALRAGLLDELRGAGALAASGDGARPSVGVVHRRSYMRGLDGVVPSSGGEEDGDARTAEEKDEEWRHPVGPGQLDYIRRQARALHELDGRLRAEGGRGIEAVGVVGTDLYDKQLTLQALRDALPATVFFTTDLDSRLLHSSQYHWSRNLVIASSFDLMLADDLQSHAPPFRDSYQTSAFLAAQLALGGVEPGGGAAGVTDANLADVLQPRVFEIARGGAWDVTPAAYASSLHPGPRRRAGSGDALRWLPSVLGCGALFYLLAGTAFGRVTAVWSRLSRPAWRAWLAVPVAAGVLALVAAMRHVAEEHDEPFAWLEGISIWPTEGLRLLVVLVCVAGLVYGAARLALSDLEIQEEFGLPAPSGRDRRSFGFWRSVGHSLGLARFDAPPGAARARDLWLRYRTNGGPWRTAFRVALMLAAYTALGVTIFEHFGRPNVPFRGADAELVDRVVLILSVLFLTLLVLFVVDATRACELFVRGLARGETAWEGDGVDRTCGEREMQPADVADLMDVRMIARRTDAVGGLIVVPFVALFLMILSRNPYFDAWDWPPSLVAILAIQSLIALLCAVRLRRAAERARSRALERLVARLSRRLGSTRDEDAAAARQLRQVMEEIRDQRQGAFSHWFQNPVVRAVLMPFGGVGVLALIDTLVKAGV